MAETSPYNGIPKAGWLRKTEELVAAHPLARGELVDVVLASWRGIFVSAIGQRGLKIGQHLFPTPQILGFFLHELIPYELRGRYPELWRAQEAKGEKDVVYIRNPLFSFEIKTSSHREKIFGNRSYAQEAREGRGPIKTKSGYYLAINFEKWVADTQPSIRLIRFGWLDHSDWVGQAAATGQQARLEGETEERKLLTLYRKEE